VVVYGIIPSLIFLKIRQPLAVLLSCSLNLKYQWVPSKFGFKSILPRASYENSIFIKKRKRGSKKEELFIE